MKLCYQFCIPHDEVLDECFHAGKKMADYIGVDFSELFDFSKVEK